MLKKHLCFFSSVDCLFMSFIHSFNSSVGIFFFFCFFSPYGLLYILGSFTLCHKQFPITWLVFWLFSCCFAKWKFSFTFLKKFIIYLFLAALGLRGCARASSSCGEWGLLFVAVHGLLITLSSVYCGAQALGTWASVVVARGLQ